MKDQIAFIIDTLETAIEWADYADDYFKKKHGLDQDRENVKKSIEILNSLEEQNQVLQSLLDLKQQEISVLESKVGEHRRCFECKDKHDCYSFSTLTEDQSYFMCCYEFEPKNKS